MKNVFISWFIEVGATKRRGSLYSFVELRCLGMILSAEKIFFFSCFAFLFMLFVMAFKLRACPSRIFITWSSLVTL